MQTYITSAFLRLDQNDFIKALAMTIIGAVLNFIYPMLVLHTLPDAASTLYVAAIAGVGYLVKNLFTPARQVTTTEAV